jgi:hypothetical protein
MNHSQWEALCDGCAKCCLHKIQDEDTGKIHFTNLACRLLDLASCRCTRYPERSMLVPECLTLTPQAVREAQWLPASCAYRLLAQGKDLPWWHPLVSGKAGTVEASGHSVRGRVVSETEGDGWEHHLADWVS